MEGSYFDRISGRSTTRLTMGRMLVGQWQLMPSSDQILYLNDVPVSAGDYLVPDNTGAWRLIDGADTVCEGNVWQRLALEDIEADAIRSMGRKLDELIDGGAGWLEWCYAVPLASEVVDSIRLRSLDRTITDNLGYLEAVCHKPSAHLRVEIERLPVSRARRVPREAVSYLASHTEDWEKELLTGVHPKRVLSEVREEQIDIYENRVAARLVDCLSSYLDRRIREVGKALRAIEWKDFTSSLEGTYLRRERILKLCGELLADDGGRARAEETAERLKALKYRVMGLMDSTLYLQIPRRAFVEPTLRSTNILTNEPNYRRVAELWRELSKMSSAGKKDYKGIYRQNQNLCRGFDLFAFLLVVRALDQLRYSPGENDLEVPVRAPFTWTLNGGATDLCWEESGRISIATAEGKITFAPLASDLANCRDDEEVEAVLQPILSSAEHTEGRLVVLYASSVRDQSGLSPSTQRKLHTVGNDPEARLPDTTAILPVSACDIGSVERVARALRWFLDGIRYHAYPPGVRTANLNSHLSEVALQGGWLGTKSGILS